MWDGWWGGIPKGLRVVLEERGINTQRMNAEQMREVLRDHPDFKNEKSSIEQFLCEEKQHSVIMLPKFHCELNPIERVWVQAKWYCKYNIISLRKNILPALDSIPLGSIQKHFGKVRHYVHVWVLGGPCRWICS